MISTADEIGTSIRILYYNSVDTGQHTNAGIYLHVAKDEALIIGNSYAMSQSPSRLRVTVIYNQWILKFGFGPEFLSNPEQRQPSLTLEIMSYRQLSHNNYQ